MAGHAPGATRTDAATGAGTWRTEEFGESSGEGWSEGDDSTITARDGTSGNSTVNVAPRPCPALSARIVPPCTCTRDLQMLKPSPNPPNCRVTVRSACSKG